MDIIIRGDKVKVTKSIDEYIREKLGKLDKYFENSEQITAHVVVRVRNLNQIIEVTVPTRDFTLRREEEAQDLYAAIDLVIDKLERQIRKNKTRFERRYKSVKEENEFNFDFNISKEEQDTAKIVKRKAIDSKPMTEEEAILQYELLHHDFFMFKNIENGCISVIYRRKDGNFGIIDMM